MHDDLFTKRILDYLQRIIYNGRQNVSSKEFFLSECRALNIVYHYEKNHT